MFYDDDGAWTFLRVPGSAYEGVSRTESWSTPQAQRDAESQEDQEWRLKGSPRHTEVGS